MMKKRWTQSVSRGVAVAVLALAGVVAAPQANAAVQQPYLVCIGSGAEEYNPPITITPQVTSITFTEEYSSCTSLGSPTVTDGGVVYGGPRTANCLVELAAEEPFAANYNWNQGSLESVVAWNEIIRVRALNGTTTITSHGGVIEGLGLGRSVTRTIVLPQLSATACATTGVSSNTGTATLTIL
ncbi:hypothetical protein [Streptomyces nitrosporeus]|uniref:hypothetical protein n=1 Tax=Streptomyces nitrosporeus TaxID=28894 RepID=UPI0039A29314